MSMAFGSPSGSPDPFSDLFNRFFGMSPASSPPAVQRVPIGRLLTEPARELLDAAAGRAVQDGTSDLDTEHLLWAATQVEPTRRLLARAGVDPRRARGADRQGAAPRVPGAVLRTRTHPGGQADPRPGPRPLAAAERGPGEGPLGRRGESGFGGRLLGLAGSAPWRSSPRARRVDPGPGEQSAGGLHLGGGPQQVLRVEVRRTVLDRPARGGVQQFPCGLGEEPPDGHPLYGGGRGRRGHSEEAVEQIAEGSGEPEGEPKAIDIPAPGRRVEGVPPTQTRGPRSANGGRAASDEVSTEPSGARLRAANAGSHADRPPGAILVLRCHPGRTVPSRSYGAVPVGVVPVAGAR